MAVPTIRPPAYGHMVRCEQRSTDRKRVKLAGDGLVEAPLADSWHLPPSRARSRSRCRAVKLSLYTLLYIRFTAQTRGFHARGHVSWHAPVWLAGRTPGALLARPQPGPAAAPSASNTRDTSGDLQWLLKLLYNAYKIAAWRDG